MWVLTIYKHNYNYFQFFSDINFIASCFDFHEKKYLKQLSCPHRLLDYRGKLIIPHLSSNFLRDVRCQQNRCNVRSMYSVLHTKGSTRCFPKPCLVIELKVLLQFDLLCFVWWMFVQRCVWRELCSPYDDEFFLVAGDKPKDGSGPTKGFGTPLSGQFASFYFTVNVRVTANANVSVLTISTRLLRKRYLPTPEVFSSACLGLSFKIKWVREVSILQATSHKELLET